jgi:hypothetical protein
VRALWGGGVYKTPLCPSTSDSSSLPSTTTSTLSLSLSLSLSAPLYSTKPTFLPSNYSTCLAAELLAARAPTADARRVPATAANKCKSGAGPWTYEAVLMRVRLFLSATIRCHVLEIPVWVYRLRRDNCGHRPAGEDMPGQNTLGLQCWLANIATATCRMWLARV